jgi:hypothetical protein
MIRLINKKTTAFVKVPPKSSEFVWKEVPTRGSWLKPTKELIKGGATKDSFYYCIFKKELELVACIDGRWCYMGSYKIKSWNAFHPDDFAALPEVVSSIFNHLDSTVLMIPRIKTTYISKLVRDPGDKPMLSRPCMQPEN